MKYSRDIGILAPWASRYALAAGFALAALLVRYLFGPILDTQSPFIVSLLGVFLSAWCCGFRPALLAGAIGATGSKFFFMEPAFQWTVRTDELLAVMLFSVTAIGVAWVTDDGVLSTNWAIRLCGASATAVIGILCSERNR